MKTTPVGGGNNGQVHGEPMWGWGMNHAWNRLSSGDSLSGVHVEVSEIRCLNRGVHCGMSRFPVFVRKSSPQCQGQGASTLGFRMVDFFGTIRMTGISTPKKADKSSSIIVSLGQWMDLFWSSFSVENNEVVYYCSVTSSSTRYITYTGSLFFDRHRFRRTEDGQEQTAMLLVR
jgi:hypothetical protein